MKSFYFQTILGMSGEKTASEDTLVPSPDLPVDVAFSEGATTVPRRPSCPTKWSSNPNQVRRKKKEKRVSYISLRSPLYTKIDHNFLLRPSF